MNVGFFMYSCGVLSFPALLHLAPNSPDAKVFEDFAKNGNGSATAEGKKTYNKYRNSTQVGCHYQDYLF